MTILRYISYIIMPMILLNNSFSMNNKMENKINNIDNRDTLVKFNDSDNRCGLASLNQCFSILNPGNNKLLQEFMQKYYNISQCKLHKNKVFDPKHIFEQLLDNTNFINNITEKDKQFFKIDCNKFLNGGEGSDVAERYQRLVNILQNTDCNINETNAFCELRNYILQNNNINYIKVIQDSFDIGIPVTNNTCNLILNNSDITSIDFYKQIQSNQIVSFNNNKFKLSALIFLCVGQDGQPNRTKGTHFVSSKQLSNGKWRLIDSSHNNINQVYEDFDTLINTHVIPKTPNAKISNRFMPKLMFFTKELQQYKLDNNKVLDSINDQKQGLQDEINNINKKIEDNQKLIMQIATENKCANNDEEELAINNFINNIINDDESVFNAIIKGDFEKNKGKINKYFTIYGYEWLFKNALEIISNILNLQQTLETLQITLSQIDK